MKQINIRNAPDLLSCLPFDTCELHWESRTSPFLNLARTCTRASTCLFGTVRAVWHGATTRRGARASWNCGAAPRRAPCHKLKLNICDSDDVCKCLERCSGKPWFPRLIICGGRSVPRSISLCVYSRTVYHLQSRSIVREDWDCETARSTRLCICMLLDPWIWCKSSRETLTCVSAGTIALTRQKTLPKRSGA